MTVEELVEAIQSWGKEKGITNVEKQLDKLHEETRETTTAWTTFATHSKLPGYLDKEHDYTHLVEEVGDIGVVWLLLCRMLDIDYQDALQAAHDKNKNRVGKTIRGNFIKASDLATYEFEKIVDKDLKSAIRFSDTYNEILNSGHGADECAAK